VIIGLRERGWTLQAIADRFGVTRQAINSLLKGSRRGSAHCTFCGSVILSSEGTGKLRGVACLACLAGKPHLPFAKVLFSLRIAAALSQGELAKQAGCARVTISILERNERHPHRQTRERLLGCLRLALSKHQRFQGADGSEWVA
jgi:transcriptional regulator with XRE-family HTH domain